MKERRERWEDKKEKRGKQENVEEGEKKISILPSNCYYNFYYFPNKFFQIIFFKFLFLFNFHFHSFYFSLSCFTILRFFFISLFFFLRSRSDPLPMFFLLFSSSFFIPIIFFLFSSFLLFYFISFSFLSSWVSLFIILSPDQHTLGWGKNKTKQTIYKYAHSTSSPVYAYG